MRLEAGKYGRGNHIHRSLAIDINHGYPIPKIIENRRGLLKVHR